MTAPPEICGARAIDIVFPGATNHHGTLFAGIGLSHMDRVAYIAAARHARADVVTASCERIDFAAPASLGDIVELTGRVARVGRRSLAVEVDMIAEHPLTGRRRQCTRGVFNMVSLTDPPVVAPMSAPPAQPEDDGVVLRMEELVSAGESAAGGMLQGSNALKSMGKAAFVAATRRARAAVVMASSQRIDFDAPVRAGEVAMLAARVAHVGRTSLQVSVDLVAESLENGHRRPCGQGQFVMVAVGPDHRPIPIGPAH